MGLTRSKLRKHHENKHVYHLPRWTSSYTWPPTQNIPSSRAQRMEPLYHHHYQTYYNTFHENHYHTKTTEQNNKSGKKSHPRHTTRVMESFPHIIQFLHRTNIPSCYKWPPRSTWPPNLLHKWHWHHPQWINNEQIYTLQTKRRARLRTNPCHHKHGQQQPHNRNNWYPMASSHMVHDIPHVHWLRTTWHHRWHFWHATGPKRTPIKL